MYTKITKAQNVPRQKVVIIALYVIDSRVIYYIIIIFIVKTSPRENSRVYTGSFQKTGDEVRSDKDETENMVVV